MNLRDFKVGETVTLKGAYAFENKPLFLGSIQADGYRLLWPTRAAYAAGAAWSAMVAGSHGAKQGVPA